MSKARSGKASDGQRCGYAMAAEDGLPQVRLECERCGHDFSPHNKACISGLVNALAREPRAASVVAGNYFVTRYSRHTVEALAPLLGIPRELENLTLRRKAVAAECAKCPSRPTAMFQSLSAAFQAGFEEYERACIASLEDIPHGKGAACPKCVQTLKDDVDFLLRQLDGAGSGLERRLHGKKKPVVKKGAYRGKRVHDLVIRLLERQRDMRPSFSSSWASLTPPANGTIVVKRDVAGGTVNIFSVPSQTENYYQLVPEEYDLPTQHVKLLHYAIQELSRRPPSSISIEDCADARAYVEAEAPTILERVSRRHGLEIAKGRTARALAMERLTRVLVRYTAGFGILETLLSDGDVNDLYLDAPPSRNPLHLTMAAGGNHDLYGRCVTNITMGQREADAIISRLQLSSGRPFSEASPILEADLPGHDTRVTVIGPPLSPDGIGMAFRRHARDPWTLLRLMDAGSISPMGAGFLSFCIDGRATMLIAGSRGAGKSSLLGALLYEFPRSQRLLVIEDTPELPVSELQREGYKVQGLSVSTATSGFGEQGADEALRVSLRLGESAIVMGEVRGQDARVLYEAMRAGTAGSSVLGTFHADSAKGVYHRAVHDMSIPQESFSATDLVVIAGLIRLAGSQKARRRVIQVAELAKSLGPGEFRDLLEYDAGADSLLETDHIHYHSELIGRIAGDWGMSMEEALENVKCRAELRRRVLLASRKAARPELLGAARVPLYNAMFWELMERHSRRGKVDYAMLADEWDAWFRKEAQLD